MSLRTQCRQKPFVCVPHSIQGLPLRVPLLAFLGWILLLAPTIVVHAGPLHLNCDPCIDRSKVEIHAVVHGIESDEGWFQARNAMTQAAKDMGIDFHMQLRETYSSQEMAQEIRNLIRYELDDSPHGHSHDVNQIDGLIVTIPDEIVAAAVQDAVYSGIHVYGFNIGYQYAANSELIGWVAQDEYFAGAYAAEEFLRRRLAVYGPPSRALFISHDKDDVALQERFRGFSETLRIAVGIEAEQVFIDPENFYETVLTVDFAIDNCSYDFVLVGGTETVEPVTAAFDLYLCDEYFQSYQDEVVANGTVDSLLYGNLTRAERRPMMIGAFDETTEILEAIESRQIEFTLSPQQYLQSALPVVLATIYSTTGKKLRVPDDTVYLSGPHLIDIDNIPSDTHLACISESFPICSYDSSTDASTICPCTDRSRLRIAGVTHGTEGDQFWEEVYFAAVQASIDMDITLELEFLQPHTDERLLHERMAAKIRSLCGSGVDGIFVSMPSELVMNAVRFCKQLRIPVVNVNSGANFASEIEVQHIGQVEYTAGWEAGERMLLVDGVRIGYCLNSEPSNVALVERCNGFKAAFENANKTYGGMIGVPMDNYSLFYSTVSTEVGNDVPENWEGIGMVVIGPVEPALKMQQNHRGLVLGTFDVKKSVFEPLDDGRLLFTIDQQHYLQGSIPVYLLTYAAYTSQMLLNRNIETGPHLVEYSLSSNERQCEEVDFVVCTQVPKEDYNYIHDSWLIFGYCAVAIVCLAGIGFLAWMYAYRNKNIVKASQPLFLMLLVFGSVVSVFAILPSGVQTGYRYVKDPMTGELTDVPNPNIAWVDAACMMSPWLYGLGFAIVFSALCAKIQRVKMIYDAGSAMRRKKVEIKDVLLIMAVVIALESCVLISWTVVSPDKWKRDVLVEEGGYTLESTGKCESEHGNTFLLTLVIFHAVCLFYTLVLCWKTSDIPTEFAEGSYISLSVLCIFQISVLVLPIAWMVEDQPDVFHFVKSMTVFLPAITTMCLIFLPKIVRVQSGDDELPFGRVAGRGSSGCTRTNFRGQGISSGQPAQSGCISSPPMVKGEDRNSAPAKFYGISENKSTQPTSEMSGVVPAERMLPFDCDIEDDDPIPLSDAYRNLKAGLDTDVAVDRSEEQKDDKDQLISLGKAQEIATHDSMDFAGDSLKSLANEISRAEKSREDVYGSIVGEHAPPLLLEEDSSVGAYYAASGNVPASAPMPFKRQDSPDIDSSVDSSSNDLGTDAMAAAFLNRNDVDVIDTSEKNPQEGSQVSHESGHQKSAPPQGLQEVGRAVDEGNHYESASPSASAASPMGITRAEASRAEIFRMPSEAGLHETPIRLKKAPEEYGENAALAAGITKASGTFLRKVAASYGSGLSTPSRSTALESKNATPVSFQTRTSAADEVGNDVMKPPSVNRVVPHRPNDSKNHSSSEFDVDRRYRPQYAALRESVDAISQTAETSATATGANNNEQYFM